MRADETVASSGAPGALAGSGRGNGARRGGGAGAAAAAGCARSDERRGSKAMSVGYRAVQWNPAKLRYDAILLAGVALYIGSFLLVAHRLDPPKDLPAA